ncbi:hypothetical protein [Clostridium sp. E02]|uniref:hypothetical protein n=1 Tax=Clostridium sp. E02 TaxID=2487134 RepID=UPI000F54A7FA|nr:hypothetical protein [Clostridium sp. E02]
MTQPITDQVGFLGEACRAVQELSVSRSLLEKFRLEEKSLSKELETERKAVTDAISLTVKKRMEEISETYDREIAKEQEHLKRVRAQREKAKNQGIKERIQEETSELKSKNKDLLLEMKNFFKQEQVPVFCRSNWFYSLYLPKGFGEFTTLFVTLMLCFLVIPYGVYYLIPKPTVLHLVMIYFAAILFFGGIYILINNKTKVKHQRALTKGRMIKNQVKDNKRMIRLIVRSIRKDRNETFYNLEKYDDEIAQVEHDLADIGDHKMEALNTFDKVTRTIISDEIADAKKEKIMQLENEYETAVENNKEAQIRVKEQTLFINDNYASYIGKEFMTPEILDKLADIIRMGKAETISQAKNFYNNLSE